MYMINVYNEYMYDNSKCIYDKKENVYFCICMYTLSHNANINFPIKKTKYYESF